MRDELQVLQSTIVGCTTAAGVRLAEQSGEEGTQPTCESVRVGFITEGRGQRLSESSHMDLADYWCSNLPGLAFHLLDSGLGVGVQGSDTLRSARSLRRRCY